MNADDLVKAINLLKPNAEFVFKDADYSTIEWIALEGDAPTLTEIQTAYQTIKAAEIQAKATTQAQKQAILDRLGLTEEELRIVLG